MWQDVGDSAIGTGPGAIINSIGNGISAKIPAKPEPRVVRLSHMSEGMLIHRVEPQYPALAKTAHIQGSVILAALIGRDGTIQNLQVVSGHPLLAPAAINAVREWRYQPYILNEVPVEVETRITVNFILSR
jgi:protein TonB